MEVDAEQDSNTLDADDIRVLGDESVAVDLTKESAEEEMEDAEEEEEDVADDEEDDDDDDESVEGSLGDKEEPLPSTDQQEST